MGRYNRQQTEGGNNGLWAGVIVLVIGILFFLNRLNLHLPRWIFSWQVILIVIGLVLGIRRQFQGAAWFILVLIGGVFLANDMLELNWDIRRFLWPSILVIVGVYLIGRSASRRHEYQAYIRSSDSTSDDYIQVTTIFSSTEKTILSKNFKGGSVSTVFGGTELNFMNADIQGEAVLDVSSTFGGIEISVPSSWEVKMDVNTIFGGVEDKRLGQGVPVPGKILWIKGSCIFGGVDLKSY